ncbi:MAG: sialidase, partial [Verrucomicrobiales bacterium]|nr:sialidase [Verrucomicrobiales bacterium]
MAVFVVWLSGLLASHAAGQPEINDIFVGGQDSYPAYRIPALVRTKRGSLLAFAEGRATLRDHAENDIVMKRSTDSGKTWGNLQLIDDAGTDALNNPTVVVLRNRGRVILMYQRYAKGFDEHTAEPGYQGPHVCRTFTTYSDDDGLKWSRPEEVTTQVKRPTEITSTAAGPGIGIQLARGPHAGRILFPFNQGPYGKWKAYAVFSDDGGTSWRYGETAPEGTEGQANEVQFVELNDGSLMLNARNQRGRKLRKVSLSKDGGQTWSPTRDDPALIEPACQASILRYPGTGDPTRDVFLFSNPASQAARTNGTIRLSRDEGKTWPVSRVLYPGSFAYSCLTNLPGGTIGCLFERDG